MDPRGKVQVMKQPEALPTNCVVCHRHADGVVQFIDIQFSLDFYGAVYFCEECMAPVAEACGFVRLEEFEKLNESMAELVKTTTALEEENDKLRNLIDSATDLKSYLEHNSRVEPLSATANEDRVEDSEPDTATDHGLQPKSDEPTNERRPKNVRKSTKPDEPRDFFNI